MTGVRKYKLRYITLNQLFGLCLEMSPRGCWGWEWINGTYSYFFCRFSRLPEHVVKSLPTVLIRKRSRLLGPGLQCRLCLKNFLLGQVAIYLPCNHKVNKRWVSCWAGGKLPSPSAGKESVVLWLPWTIREVEKNVGGTPGHLIYKTQKLLAYLLVRASGYLSHFSLFNE